MKKRIPSIVICVLNLILLMSPWLTIEGQNYNIFQFVYKATTDGLVQVILMSGVGNEFLELMKFAVIIELCLFGFYILGTVIYLLKRIVGKSSGLNKGNLFFCISALFLHMSGTSLSIFSPSLWATCIPFALLLLTALECFISILIDRWDETVTGIKKYESEEEKRKREEKERLRFDGKYTRLFYKFVWKNFKRNIRDYALLLFSNSIIFGSVVVGIGMKEMLAVENTSQGTRLFNGLNRILVNAMIPMGIIAVFIFVLLFFHYVKCRSRNFGVFLTLGMRRNMLYRFITIEYMSILFIAMTLGGVLATVSLKLFAMHSLEYIGIEIPASVIGVSVYGKAILILFAVCVVSLLAAKEVFRDFNVGNSTDLRAISEKIPLKLRKLFLTTGGVLCLISIIRYRNLENFENVQLLVVFFIGMFLIIRYGMAEYLICERKSKKYLRRLMMHHQLFHKSKTSAGYIGGFFVIQFCVLFYFLFQVISANIASDVKSLFPYDAVCLADGTDDKFFKELEEKYGVEMKKYPALRVSAFDSTEQTESVWEQTAIQGQHIGISESTYHELKKQIDDDYEAKALGLDADGEYVHIVYQQDQSEYAKPTAFYIPRSKPFLHIGQPCRSVDKMLIARKDLGYKFYQVKSEEKGSLIGIFHQGTKENLIVFSDEYFEKAKHFWKTRNINTGELVEEGEPQGFITTIHQGITKLVLLNIDADVTEEVRGSLEQFEDKHIKEEEAIHAWNTLKPGVYDRTVAYHYMKEEAMKNLLTERVMKMTMNGLVILVFFCMNIMLFVIKLLSEKEMNLRRTEFFQCMGMRKKDRIRLMRDEMFRYYYLVPTGLAVIFGGVFMKGVFHARMFGIEDIKAYIENLIPLGLGYLLVNTVIIFMIATFYAKRMEK